MPSLVMWTCQGTLGEGADSGGERVGGVSGGGGPLVVVMVVFIA